MTKTNVTLAKAWLTFDDFVYVVWPFYVLVPKDLVSCMLSISDKFLSDPQYSFWKNKLSYKRSNIWKSRFVYNILQIDTGKEHTE